MATILIRRPHRLTLDEVRERAEQLARKIEQRLSVAWRWESAERMRLVAPTGPAGGTRGTVVLGPDQVQIEVELPFMLRPVKNLLEGKLHDKLDSLLGPA